MVLMADRRVLEVSRLPSHLYDDDLIRDKILIHFLRRRNGGGCDVTPRYPTEEEGVALLVFEDEKVANTILSRTHTLVINDRTHPLEVRRPQPRASQFSMPVKTYLHTLYFSNISEVKQLLERHGLSVYQGSSSLLGIKGDFCDLQRCRQDLYKILARQNLTDKSLSPPEPITSKRLLSEERSRQAPQTVSATPDRRSPSSSRGRPEGRGHVAQDKHNTGIPTHPDPPESSTRAARAPTPTRVQKVSTPKLVPHIFHVDPTILRYVKTFRLEKIDKILTQYNVDMKEENCDGFTSITLTSLSPSRLEDFEKACNEIKRLFDHYNNRLRDGNIELPTSSRYSREEISKMMQKDLQKREVCSTPGPNHSLYVIGPSETILTLMQEWKGSQGGLAPNIGEDSGSPRSAGSLTQHSSPRTGPHESRLARAPTPTRVQKDSAPKPLAHSFHVDAAVLRYVKTFGQETIDQIVRQYNADMKEENSDGFTSITLTSLSPSQPERFKYGCGEMRNLFSYYTNYLQAENIELPIRWDEEMTRKFWKHLLSRDICPVLGADHSLQVIGPPHEILTFLQEWKGTQGGLVQDVTKGSGSPRSPNMAANSKTSTQPEKPDGRSRRHEAGPDAHSKGRENLQNGTGSGRGKSSGNPVRPWR
ncbi:uncharacterized protein RB166_005959 [Leptodactylus fuscus]|uniref:uncharacterized protein LOC142199976 n=1 Tax=Leptodactylus fuscus TaxID=238119 RepID=UPI003F4F1B36